MSELKVTRKEHLGYVEWNKASHKLKGILREPMFGRWQYIYKYNRQEFSLIQFHGEIMEMSYGKHLWEILFPDGEVMRFKSKQEAEEYIIANY